MSIIRLMTAIRVALVLSITMTIAIGLPPVARAASSCKVKTNTPSSARTFAKISNQSTWREYKNLEGVPDLELNNGMSAQFWQDRSKNRSVTIVEPGQEFWSYTRYCFNSNGELEGVGFEVRTELGWGLRAEGSLLGSGFYSNSQEFFSLKNGKTIAKPEGVGAAPVGLRPTVYRNVSELPFAQMLKVSARSKRHSR